MTTVYKYPFYPVDIVTLMLPDGAQILRCDDQPGVGWCAWALVNTGPLPLVEHNIRMAGTGHSIDPEPLGRFINTAVTAGGALVFHFFELEKPQ